MYLLVKQNKNFLFLVGYVNNWDEFFAFQCNNHGFIHGMRSIHDNHSEDRRWDFYCCEHDGLLIIIYTQCSELCINPYFKKRRFAVYSITI